MENNNLNLSNDHMRKILYRFSYTLNESPRYRPIIGTDEQFDEVPNINEPSMSEADDNIEEPKGETPIDVNDTTDVPEAPTPEFDKTGGDEQIDNLDNVDISTDTEPISNPEQDVNAIQNDIIRQNIETMKSLDDKLNNLELLYGEITTKMAEMSSEVEEVREPSNGEKLMKQKEVSYPYYFNLNDYWKTDNMNDNNMLSSDNKGIRELPDGTFIADFDDLPQKSKMDIEKSFYDYDD